MIIPLLIIKLLELNAYRQNALNIISENLLYKIYHGKEIIKQNCKYFVTENDFDMNSNFKIEPEIKYKNAVIKDTFWITNDFDIFYDILLSFSIQKKIHYIFLMIIFYI